MFDYYKLFNRLPTNKMLLNNALQHLRRTGMIPRAFRINDGNRPILADAQTVGFGSKNAPTAGQVQFL